MSHSDEDLPYYEEWQNILSNAEQYTYEYLSNPDMWIQKHYQNGKMLFYDDETSNYMENRNEEHLIDTWVVEMELNGTNLHTEITATKEVDGWNLEELLSQGTKDYEIPEEGSTMVYWYRFSNSWQSGKKRKGIRQSILSAYQMFIDDAVDYGLRKAIDEWYDT